MFIYRYCVAIQSTVAAQPNRIFKWQTPLACGLCGFLYIYDCIICEYVVHITEYEWKCPRKNWWRLERLSPLQLMFIVLILEYIYTLDGLIWAFRPRHAIRKVILYLPSGQCAEKNETQKNIYMYNLIIKLFYLDFIEYNWTIILLSGLLSLTFCLFDLLLIIIYPLTIYQ